MDHGLEEKIEKLMILFYEVMKDIKSTIQGIEGSMNKHFEIVDNHSKIIEGLQQNINNLTLKIEESTSENAGLKKTIRNQEETINELEHEARSIEILGVPKTQDEAVLNTVLDISEKLGQKSTPNDGNSEVKGLGSGSQFGHRATGANAKRSENNGWRRNQRNRGGNKNVRNYIVEPSKFLNLRGNSEVEGHGFSQFGQWATGAAAKRSENKSFNNKFALLGHHDDKKSSSSSFSSMNCKGTAPSPSLEKEWMMSAIKQLAYNDLQRRGGSGSGPSSRESSRQRYGTSPASSLLSSSTMSRDDDRPRDLREFTSLKDSSKDHLNNQHKEELMSEEKLLRQTRMVTQEWITDKNVEETCRMIEEIFIGANLIQFVHTGLSDVLVNSKSGVRTLFGELLVILIKDKKLVQTKEVKEGFSKLIVLAEDLIIDVPKIWQYFANLIVPLLTHEVFNFADVKAAAKQTSKENLSVLLVEIIKLLIKEKGPSWIKTQWEASQVQIKDFVPDNVEVGSFTKNHNLGFISGNCEVQPQPDDTLTSSEIEERLYSFLKSDSNKACNHACDWIKVNISEKVTGSNVFIKAVTRAVLRASIITDKEKLSMQHFQYHKNLIQKFVGNDEKRELACLYAVQNLLFIELEVQSALIVEIFYALYNLSVISHDGFLKWKSDETTTESEGKEVLLKVLPSFFVMLDKGDDTEEES